MMFNLRKTLYGRLIKNKIEGIFVLEKVCNYELFIIEKSELLNASRKWQKKQTQGVYKTLQPLTNLLKLDPPHVFLMPLFHPITMLFRTFSPGLENIDTFLCSSDSFPH